MECNLPLVSVITATYQKFERIPETIKSVFMQDYKKIEYIISDDGSNDFPEEFIMSVLNKENNGSIAFKVIHHDKNIGTVRNLNEAYRLSRGKYIINLSCGDVFFDKNVVSKIVDRFEKNHSDVIVTSRILYYGDYNPICLLPHYKERFIISRFSTKQDQYRAFITRRFYDMASGSAMSFSRQILEKMCYFDERYRIWEDGPFLAKYLRTGPLDYAYDIVSIWYETGGVSSSQKKERKREKSQLEIDTEIFNTQERIEHIKEFSILERRLIRFKNLQHKYKRKKIRYLLVFIFPFEFIYFLIYYKKRKNRIPTDLREIHKLVTGAKNYNIE